MKQFLLRNKHLLIVFLFLVPLFFVFRSFFGGKVLFGGDAPYFYPSNIKDLFSEPLTWTERGISFGGINQLLWLSPLMFIYGLLGTLLHLSNDLILRLLFLFPPLLLSSLGPYFFSRYLKLGKVTAFFTSFIYVFNTYYILLVDGGQVGIALSYGLFPLTLLFLKRLVDKINYSRFFLALLFSFALTIFDPRVFVICFLTVLIWLLVESLVYRNWRILKILAVLLLLGLFLIPLNFYWLLPILKLGGGVSTSVSDLGLISLINPIFLFSPNWPQNVFGKINYPYFYFGLVPILIFGSLVLKRNKQILVLAIVFLVFSFLSKGSTFPFGGLYDVFINKIPFVSAFRDSSKFLIPIFLIAGMLIGETVSSFKSKTLHVIIYLYLLLLISPALLGKLNFLLSNHSPDNSYSSIYQNLSKENEFARSAWFTIKAPLSYESNQIAAVDGRDLADFAPFFSINASEDVFNFLNNPKFVEWFKVLGIKYVFLDGDPRNIYPTDTDIKNWSEIVGLIENTKDLVKLNWGLNFPGYQILGAYPKVYSVQKLVGVVGPYLEDTTPAIYFEDGKWDPSILKDKDPNSISIFLNSKDKVDLTMSFLEKYFLSSRESQSSNWAIYSPSQNLKAKYELLIRGVAFKDLDYGKGIAFSTKRGETIDFKFNVPKDGKYVIAYRSMTPENKELLLRWHIEAAQEIKKGNFDFTLTNDYNLQVFNVIALMPEEEYKSANTLAESFINKFGTYQRSVLNNSLQPVVSTQEGTLSYGLKTPQNGFWIILNESYNPSWKLVRGINPFASVPVYSMENAFYFEPDWGDLHIVFTGQEAFRWGTWVSLISVLLYTATYLFIKIRSDEKQN